MQRNISSILLQGKKEAGDIDNGQTGVIVIMKQRELWAIGGPVAGLDIGLAIRTRMGRKWSKGIYPRNTAE